MGTRGRGTVLLRGERFSNSWGSSDQSQRRLVLGLDFDASFLPGRGLAVGFAGFGFGVFALGVVIVVVAAVVVVVLVGRHVDVVEDDAEEVAADFFDHLLGADGHGLG